MQWTSGGVQGSWRFVNRVWDEFDSQPDGQVVAEPDAELFIHPECGCATSALYLASSGVVPEDRT